MDHNQPQLCLRSALAVLVLLFALACTAYGGDITLHSSGRYYQDASGKPVFLIGYYGWAAVTNGYYIDHPSQYSSMITQGTPYKINYIRISLGVNRFTGSTNPNSWDNRPTPVPFLYVNGKADLDQWDPVFWQGLRDQCALAQQNGVIVHVSIFDGVDFRGGGEAYRYANSFWKPSNQTRAFYADPDKNGDGNIDANGEFYQLDKFNSTTDIGYYQKRLIDKVISETAAYDNVFYEVGNELLSSPSDWNSAVIGYIRSKTSKAVSHCGGDKATNLLGWSQHAANTPAEVKANVASIVGMGYPAWEDPDGPALSDLDVTADDLRRAAWYAFVGGAPCWGGFTVDFWSGGYGFSTTKATYYKNLQEFIQDSGVQFQNMLPQHTLVSNSSVNSCLAKIGSDYIAYILNDPSATLNLSAVSGNVGYRLYDPRTGAWSATQFVEGGGTRTFNKPAGADDWVILVGSAVPPPAKTLCTKPAGSITIDGSASDWNLSEFTTSVHGGEAGKGDYALVGFDGGTLYYGGKAPGTFLPTSAADHTARVYSRYHADYQYFLVRCDDDDIRYPNAVNYNRSNDCVEFYIDPSHDGGSSALNNSTSDILLVIDANNQKNVYMCTDAYKNQVLAGVTSAVVRDTTGWWLEVKIQKSALDPDIPATGRFGIDFGFRDNDNNNDPLRTTVYTWNDGSTTASFPSRIPNNWGDIDQSSQPFNGVISLPGNIQAEDYDIGGEGVAYHDTSPGNSGAVYRNDDVDIQATSDAVGGYNIGWTDTGEWLAYTVNVATAGEYDIKLRVAAPNAGGAFHIEMDGQNVTGTQSIPSTGGWQVWTTVTVPRITLTAGLQILKVVVDSGGWSFNYMDIITSPPVPVDWKTLGPINTIGSGNTPGIATDASGNLHLVYMSNSRIYYRKYDSSLNLLISDEQVPLPGGTPDDYNTPHVVCDPQGWPHLVFQKYGYASSKIAWYTNRIGGTWRTPIVALNPGTDGTWRVNSPRIVLYGQYAFVSAKTADPYEHPNDAAQVARLSNLSSTPTVDKTIGTYVWLAPAVTSSGQFYAIGRNQAIGHYYQQYDLNLNPVGSGHLFSIGTYSKTGDSCAALVDKNGTIHAVGWAIRAPKAGDTKVDCCQFFHNTVQRASSGQSSFLGLDGGSNDPEGNESTGWWNEEVWPVLAGDATGKIYMAYREWAPGRAGKVTLVDNGFYEPPVTFAPNTGSRVRWNASIAPAINGGVYIAWESGGMCYFRGVGVGSAVTDVTPPTTTAIPAGGVYNATKTVALSASEPSIIYYTTDGADPTTSSSIYWAPITISSSTTLKFFAVDPAGNAESPKKQEVYTILTGNGSIADAKTLANDEPVSLGDKVLYYRYNDFGYIEEQDRSCGIRITGTMPPILDRLVCLTGTMKTTDEGERYIQLDRITGSSAYTLKPLGMNNRSLIDGGRPMDGLFVRAWGKVITGSIVGNTFRITDGFDSDGIKVVMQGIPGVSDGQYVMISGAAGFDGARVVYVK